MNDFATGFSVDQTPEEAFDAITNVREWWSEEINGGTAEPDDVSWLMLENYFDFTADKAEWTGTTVCSSSWGSYINGSLRNLITTGEGQPNARGDWASGRPRPPAPSADAPRAVSTEVPA